MRRILFLASNFPVEQEQYFLDRSMGATSNANNSFQWAIINGLQENGAIVDVITVPNIGAYPVRFKQLKIPRFTFNLANGGKGISILWWNLLFLKHASIFCSLRAEIKKIDLSRYDYVIVYDLYPPFFELIKELKFEVPNLKLIGVVPDIIGMTRGKSNLLLKLFDKMSINKIQQGADFMDGFVYLTKYMIEKMPTAAIYKPSLIIEGISNPDILNIASNSIEIFPKYLLYTGSLDIRHGVLNLIDAFNRMKRKDIELWICGDGDGKDNVLRESYKNPLIKYFGQKPRREVILLQSNAFLLVNPRTSDGEFTKYSFPSKIIEYFLSGRPTFMYKLPGIPDEYFNYCFTNDNENIESLTDSLDNIAETRQEELLQKGLEAREFILKNKSSKIQAGKLLKFFEGL